MYGDQNSMEPSDMTSLSLEESYKAEDHRSSQKEIENLMVAGILEEGIPSPPDGGWGWVVVGASFMCNIILDACTSSFGVLLPLIAADFEAGIGTVAWAGSLLCGVSLLVGPIVSSLVNKYDCRLVCIVGSIITALAFISASLFATNLIILFFTYGLMGGIGFGMVYLPAIVCVGYYFESKRALATGLAVSGSGVGAISSAPIVTWLTGFMDWRGVCLLFAGMVTLCGVAGTLMRPLQIKLEPLDEDGNQEEPKTLFQRLAETKKLRQMENGSAGGSDYFVVQLSDGTMERRRKRSMNVDPGVQSALNLDQMQVATGPAPDTSPVLPLTNVLPTITESDAFDPIKNGFVERDPGRPVSEMSPLKRRERRISEDSCDEELRVFKQFRYGTAAIDPSQKGSASQISTSFAEFGTPRERKYSLKMVLTASNLGSTNQLQPSSTAHSYTLSRRDSTTKECKFLLSRGELTESPAFKSRESLTQPVRILRPLSRKDIFYTGSIERLPEFQSQKSLNSYHQSVVNLPTLAREGEGGDKKPDLRSKKIISIFCPCFKSEVFRITLHQLLRVELLTNPVFLVIAFSGFVGMLGFHIPIVYGIDFAVKKGIDKDKAAFLMSILGITSIFGRVGFGIISDRPQVNSLLLNNICILLMGISTVLLPFFNSFEVIVAIYFLYGICLSGFIALTSIILVDLLGLENLTNAFGLLIFFRGISSIVGTPIAGIIYDSTESYSVPFFLAGGLLIASGLISFMAPWISRYAPPKPPLQSMRPSSAAFQLEDILEAIESESETAASLEDVENASNHDIPAPGTLEETEKPAPSQLFPVTLQAHMIYISQSFSATVFDQSGSSYRVNV